jgi:hypothetical protein
MAHFHLFVSEAFGEGSISKNRMEFSESKEFFGVD